MRSSLHRLLIPPSEGRLPTAARMRAAWLLAIGVIALLLFFPATAPTAVARALQLCIRTVIPSLFPMLVLTGFLAELGLGSRSGRRGVLSRLLGVSAIGVRICLLSVLSGFPHAARICRIAIARGELSTEEADRITAFATVPSAAFVIGAIGQGMLASPHAGVLLYAIQLLSAFFTACTLRLLFPPRSSLAAPIISQQEDTPPVLALLAASIREGAVSMLGICGTVIFFSVLPALAAEILPSGIPIKQPLLLFLAGLIEITEGSARCIAELPRSLLCPILSVICAWSGLSVHAQVSQIAFGHFAQKHYFTGKLISCLYALLLGILLQNFL